jgi:hypothetical protein
MLGVEATRARQLPSWRAVCPPLLIVASTYDNICCTPALTLASQTPQRYMCIKLVRFCRRENEMRISLLLRGGNLPTHHALLPSPPHLNPFKTEPPSTLSLTPLASCARGIRHSLLFLDFSPILRSILTGRGRIRARFSKIRGATGGEG